MMPRIIHFIWFGPAMPAWVQRNIEEFRRLNPAYEVRIHDESVLLPQYAATYARIEDVCTKSDVLAVSALQRFGGWYFDTDYWPFRGVEGIVEAYGLDGRTMFVTEQHGQRNPALETANGLLAATTDWSGWPWIESEIVNKPSGPIGRCDFGPVLMTRLYKEHPEAFVRGSWPFFYPAEIGRAERVYPVLVSGRSRVATRLAPTQGQYPFTMHLWAGGETVLTPGRDANLLARIEPRANADALADGPWRGRRAVILALELQWKGHVGISTAWVFPALAEGLARIGFEVEVRRAEAERQIEIADLGVVWNGRRAHFGVRMAEARELGLPVLQIEHGFFERSQYVQADHAGILHWASWTNGELRRPAPADGAERLARVWPRALRPFEPRKGYVLLIGQLAGDTQMQDSELKALPGLETAVARALPKGVQAVVRPHPLDAKRDRPRHRTLPRCPAPTLAEAIEGARFAVMINSNAGNECLALGCPVLALGPSLYGRAGVAKETPLAGLKAALGEMLEGWRPDAGAVRNYLEWLACRQWNAEELREGRALDGLVKRAL